MIYRVMKRLNDNSLVSPYAIPPFLQTSITSDDKHCIIPYGFAFSKVEKAKPILRKYGYTDYNSKLELWSINVEKSIPISYNLHPYKMHNEMKDYADILGECFFNNNFKNIPIKISMVLAQDCSLFCKNIELVELLLKNY